MRNKGFRLAVALAAMVLWLPAAAPAEGLQEVKDKGRLRVAVYKDFPPFSNNGKGIDVDLAAALADKLGVKLELFWLQADENVEDDLRNAVWKGHYLGGGIADVMLHAPVDPEYAKRIDKVRLFGPYYQERLEVVRNLKRIPLLPNLQIFGQERIGVELDSISSLSLLSAFGGRLRSNVVHYRTPREAVAAMKQGEIAAVMAPRTELEAALGEDSQGYAIAPVATPGITIFAWTPGLAVKAENGELAGALEAAMGDLIRSGTVQSIFKKYGITHIAP